MRSFRRSLVGVAALAAPMAYSQGLTAPDPQYYGYLDMRHHLNAYFDGDDVQEHQDPSVHLRAQLGARLYGGILDVYGTTGVVKRPQTQQVLQRRPEVEIDYAAIRGPFQLMPYAIVYLPFAGEEGEIRRDDEGVSAAQAGFVRRSEGAIVAVGLRPSYTIAAPAASGVLTGRARLDLWSRFYSRKQFAPVEGSDSEVEVVDPLLFAKPAIDLEWVPEAARSWSFQLGAAHRSGFVPTYRLGEAGRVDGRYRARRSSLLRARVRYDISPRLTVLNDFYTFHEGFFARDRTGGHKRHRNILRLVCQL